MEEKRTETVEQKKSATVSRKRKVQNAFFNNQDFKDIVEYVVFDEGIPILKKGLAQFFCNTVNKIFGVNVTPEYTRNDGKRDYTPAGVAKNNATPPWRTSSEEDRSAEGNTHNIGDCKFIELDSEEECISVKEKGVDIIEKYGTLSVARLYEFEEIGWESKFTANNWGWKNFDSVSWYKQSNGKYRLLVPEYNLLK